MLTDRAADPGPAADIDAAVEADHAAVVWHASTLPGAIAGHDAHGQHVWSGLASGFFNNAILARWPESAEVPLTRLVAEARDRGAPWRFYLSAASTPSDLVRRLADLGLSPGAPGRGMVLDGPLVEPARVADLIIEPVADDAGLERWIGVRAASSRWPDTTIDAWRIGWGHLGYARDAAVRSWVGRIGADTVSCISLHQVRTAEIAGVYHVETVPSARRRGIASAMTAHVITEARRRGARRIVLSACRMAERTYGRLGFIGSGEFTYWYDEDLGA